MSPTGLEAQDAQVLRHTVTNGIGFVFLLCTPPNQPVFMQQQQGAQLAAQCHSHGLAALCNTTRTENLIFCFWLNDSENRGAEQNTTSCTGKVS